MPLANDLTKFTTSSPSLVTYDFNDTVDGTGKATYYLNRTTLQASSTFFLGTEAYTSAGTTTTTTDFTADLTSFVTPRTMVGTAIASFYMGGGSTGTIGIKLQHVDGVTSAVTDITAESTTGSYDTTVRAMCIQIPLTANTLFKTGDKLRVSVNMTSNALTFNNPTYPFKLQVSYRKDE